MVGGETKKLHCPQFLSARISARESLHISKRESACMTSMCVSGICVGVSSGKGGICQSPCRQLACESSQTEKAIQKIVVCALESGCFHG